MATALAKARATVAGAVRRDFMRISCVLPVMDDGGAAPEPTAGPIVDGGKDQLPGVNLDPILIEPVDEPVEVVLL